MGTHLPLSGEVLDAVLGALGLRADLLDPQRNGGQVFSLGSWGRFSKGADTETRKKMVSAFASTVVGAGLLPAPTTLKQEWPQIVAGALAWHVQQWDAIVGRMASAAPVRADLAPRPFLRLVAIDLALRAGAVGGDREEESQGNVPLWAEGENDGNYLRSLVARCKPRLTRDTLTKDLETNHTTVDRWLDGEVCPDSDSVQRLAAKLASTLKIDPVLLQGKLRAHYTLRALCDGLAGVVGRTQVEKLATAHERFRRGVRAAIGSLSLSEEERAALALLGSRAPQARRVLEVLSKAERHPLWLTELQAAAGDWVDRLEQATRQLSMIDDPDLGQYLAERGVPKEVWKRQVANEDFIDLLQADIELPPVLLENAPAPVRAAYAEVQGDEAHARKDLPSVVRHFRRATELEPLNARYQFRLGCAQWQLGLCVRNTNLVREGVQTLWIAHRLEPTWDRPLVEIAIVHLSLGDIEQARQHLEGASEKLSKKTHWFNYHLGAARMRAGHPREALVPLREAIAAEPRDGRALDDAAHCCFVLGDHREGAKYAKRARECGWPRVYDRWKTGGYPKGRAG